MFFRGSGAKFHIDTCFLQNYIPDNNLTFVLFGSSCFKEELETNQSDCIISIFI